MPYRRTFFKKDQPLHILSRAVEERKIFADETDCCRFIFQLYAANIGKPAFNLWRRDTTKVAQAILQGDKIPSKFIIKEHPPLVYFLDFALVVNHYHFYLVPNVENGIPLYMQKLNLGFAKYFNLKYGREGTLFATRYKSILVETELQSDAVSRYVSIINPLDIYQPSWREKGLKRWKEAFKFLENYQFSSFPDKIGRRKSGILAPEKILEIYLPKTEIEDKNTYVEFANDFLKQKLAPFQPFFLE